MTAKSVKPGKALPRKARGASGSPADAKPVEAEKTFFRVRATAGTLGTPLEGVDGAPVGTAGTAPAQDGGLISRWLRLEPAPPRQPRRRTPPATNPEKLSVTLPEGAEGVVVEGEEGRGSGPEAVDSYRSASDLTEPEEPPKSEFTA